MVRTIQEGQWFRPETAFTKLYKSVPFTEKRPRLPAWNWYQRWLLRNQNRNTAPFEKVQMSLDCSIRLLQTDITIWRSSAGQTSIFTCDELNYNKFKICMIIYSFGRIVITEHPLAGLVWFSWLVRRVPSLTADPTDDLILIKVDPN